MSDWPLEVERLGAALERAIARRQRRSLWRRLPALAPAVGIALLVATAAAVGTTGIIRDGIPVPWSGVNGSGARALPLEPSRAADPAGGPAWGIRLSKAGPLVCVTVGQVVGGRIGVVRARTFHSFPAAYHDSCARIPADGAIVRWAQYPGPNVGPRGARTLVYGIAGPQVVQVEVVAGSVSRSLPLSPHRAFVSAYPGLRSPRHLQLRATRVEGSSKLYGGAR